MSAGTDALHQALRDRRVLICVGAGGVGKTTVSAALAVRAAQQGRSSLVCTIDPARRLANSLGLSQLGNTESVISTDRLTQAGLPLKAPLSAMMLDMKQAWDELIELHSTPERREKILNNRFYQSLSTALAGSQEYIAMEKLWQLRSERDYGVIVLDTPPTAHALDFLDAPNRILDFLDNEAAKWLLTPALAAGKVGLQLFNLGGSYVAKTLSKLTGTETLQELSNFMLAISGLNKEFRERAHQVNALLKSEQTSFVLVTVPSAERLDEVVHFRKLLLQNGMNVATVVVNRVHVAPTQHQRAEAGRLPSGLAEKMHQTLDEVERLAGQDAQGIAALRRECAPVPLVLVPRFELDVHDLEGLGRTGQYLVGEARVGD
ncbi:MAG: ArsA family ATPase [Myxococcaceae bacterium]